MSAPPSMQSLGDGELMERVVRREERAFSELYRRLSRGLYSVIFEMIREQKDAEDVLQETFIQLWKRAETYDSSRSSLFTWSVMIARHRAIDRLRILGRRHRDASVVAEEFESRPQAEFVSGADVAAQKDERSRVLAALAQLPQEQRSALECAFFGGLTHEEISEKFSAPLGTIKARIRRGLMALREVLRRS